MLVNVAHVVSRSGASKHCPVCGCRFSSSRHSFASLLRAGGPIGRALDRALGLVDNAVCPRDRFAAPSWQTGHAFAVGLLIFTPGDLAAHEVVYGDRPDSSVFFASDNCCDAPDIQLRTKEISPHLALAVSAAILLP